jgi:putative DNA methylase
LEAYASDLNPVAVLINKALIEIPPKFAGRPPVNLESSKTLLHREWKGSSGLVDDVRYFGKWMRDVAWQRIGHLYPMVRLPKEQGGGEAIVIAWIWARTVACPNPACSAQMPLVRLFSLSNKEGKEVWVEPIVDRTTKMVHFEVRYGPGAPEGTVNRSGAKCIVCGRSVSFDYIRTEGKAKRMGTQLMAIAAEGKGGRTYLRPSAEHESIAKEVKPNWGSEAELSTHPQYMAAPRYGMTRHRDLFTSRQLVALTTFCDLTGEAHRLILEQSNGDIEYADAVATYLGLGIGRSADFWCTIATWSSQPKNEIVGHAFGRQALPMTWDFGEINPFSESGGNFLGNLEFTAKAVGAAPSRGIGHAQQLDATTSLDGTMQVLISTDPPYYDNVPYADLSDFFYVWLRRSIGKIYPNLFSTLLAPKRQELVADHFRHGSRENAQRFFEEGLGNAFACMRKSQHPDYPLTVYYAFKQTESTELEEGGNGHGHNSKISASTGWETMLEGLLKAGFAINGTWPIRTERPGRLRETGSNALASSIILVCRPRPMNAPLTTRRDFLNALKRELPKALKDLQRGNIAPVDLAQAAIGPGMAVFSRYSKVLESDGTEMRVRIALQLINQALDEGLAEQEGEYDADTRWAVAWFEQYAMEEGQYGVAETLSKAKNTAVGALVDSGILRAQGGKVRLLRRDEFSSDWKPATAKRLTVWEVTQRLIRTLQEQGDAGAATILDQVGTYGEVARDLAYRLYVICERKKWTDEALAYNSLVVEWSDIGGAVEQLRRTTAEQAPLFS